MNDHQHIEIVTGAANTIIASLQNAIFSAMRAASEGVEMQAKLAAAFQRLEAQEAILGWLVQRRVDQETRLKEGGLRPAQRALIRQKIRQIDEELAALLRSSGIDGDVARRAVARVGGQPRLPGGNTRRAQPPARNGRR